MKTQSAKAAGRTFQQEVAKLILAEYPELTADDVVSRSMGAGGVDIMLSSAALKAFPYSVECKRHAKLNFAAAWKQCAANAKLGTIPLLVFKKPRGVIYCARLGSNADYNQTRTNIPVIKVLDVLEQIIEKSDFTLLTKVDKSKIIISKFSCFLVEIKKQNN